MQFGALRVVNDDYVQPKAGFGSHPHRDAEIFSYVLEGQLSHKDSMGHKEALGRGCIQYMSAGTGVVHSVSMLASCQCWLLFHYSAAISLSPSKIHAHQQ